MEITIVLNASKIEY